MSGTFSADFADLLAGRERPDIDKFKHEYTSSIDVLKAYLNLQFAQLSIFAVLNASALVALHGKEPLNLSPLMQCLAPVAVASVSTAFLLIQLSMMYIVSHFIKRIAQLEFALGYRGFRTMGGMPTQRFQPARIALTLIYCLVTLAWCVAAGLAFAALSDSPQPSKSSSAQITAVPQLTKPAASVASDPRSSATKAP